MKKLLVVLRRKRSKWLHHLKNKVVRSQNQALSHIAKSMQDLASLQIKRAKLMIEADRKDMNCS